MANFPSSFHSQYSLVDNQDDVLATHPNVLSDELLATQTKIGLDSSADATSMDYFLKHASGAYRTHLHDGSSNDGAKIPIANIVEITIASIQNQQYLRYNSSSGKWENYTLSIALTSLSDIVIVTPASREGLFYNTGTSKWNNGYANAVYAS